MGRFSTKLMIDNVLHLLVICDKVWLRVWVHQQLLILFSQLIQNFFLVFSIVGIGGFWICWRECCSRQRTLVRAVVRALGDKFISHWKLFTLTFLALCTTAAYSLWFAEEKVVYVQLERLVFVVFIQLSEIIFVLRLLDRFLKSLFFTNHGLVALQGGNDRHRHLSIVVILIIF